MYPNGNLDLWNVGKILLYLQRVSYTNESQKVKYKFFCRDKFMKEYYSIERSGCFDGPFPAKFNCRIQMKSLLYAELRELLRAEDTLTVCCELKDPDAGEQENPPSNIGRQYTVSHLDDGVKVLIRDLQNTCEKESNSDVRLKVGNAEFPAHKFILATRSPVFASILKENPSSEVIELDVDDCSVVKDFLRYMYTGKLGGLTSASAPELFAAANIYDLKQLQEECLMFIKTHISVGNVCGYVKLASKYENAELMARAKTFFNENVVLVISSIEWPDFAKECPALAIDLLQFTLVTGREGKTEYFNNEHKKLLEDLTTVCETAPFPDVILKVGEEEFPAHKAILSVRSSVFRAMFEADMKENRERVVDIREMSTQTARAMLHYIYTGNVCDLGKDSARNLYAAADRYELQGLTACCQQFLLENISVDNVCQVTLLADLHSDDALQAAAREFLRNNQQQVIQSDIWNEYATEQPAFFLKLISSTLLNRETSKS